MTNEEAKKILKSLIPKPIRGDGKSATRFSILWALLMGMDALDYKEKTVEREHRLANKHIDELVEKMNTDLSTYMYDENGNETNLHKDIMQVVEEYKKGKNDADTEDI